MQHAWELVNDAKSAEDAIEQYAALGGDGGLTERTMRQCCMLPPKEDSGVHMDPLSVLAVNATRTRGDNTIGVLEEVAAVIRDYLMAEEKDMINWYSFKTRKRLRSRTMHAPSRGRNCGKSWFR